MSLNRTQYYALLESYLPDNASQLISPADIRYVLVDLVESIPNFVTDRELDTTNLGFFDYRSTRVGDHALYYNYTNSLSRSEDNTGLGYSALRGNYSGIRNTAVGSYALGCNLYGSENVSVGFLNCGGNLDGSGNVSIGNYALIGNKYGDFNIAIGHGAGNDVHPSAEYQFYLGAAPIAVDCSGIDFTHLMRGDLKNLRLAVAHNNIHDHATLQVHGHASPSIDSSGNLGSPYVYWSQAFIASGLNYPDNKDFIISNTTKLPPSGFVLDRVITLTSGGQIGFGTALPSSNLALITADGHIVPAQDSTYSLGLGDLKWNGVFGNIIVSGTAVINDLEYVTKTQCLYECATLHLATSGLCNDDIFNSSVCGYLPDEGIDGAGFEVHSSGADYRRDYHFIYRFPDQTLSCLENDNNYSRSRWESNISLAVTSGNHVQTQRILSKDNLALVSEPACFGAFVRTDEKFTVGKQPLLSSGTDFVNFVQASGFNISRIVHGSGVTIKDRFLSRNKTRGFDLVYIDAGDVLSNNQSQNRFIVRGIDSAERDSIVILRSGIGNVGISNFSGAIPQTVFNVQSSGTACDARFTSLAFTPVNLQLLVNNNIPASGFEISYTPVANLSGNIPDLISRNQPIVHFSTFAPSGGITFKKSALSIAANNFIGIGTTQLGSTSLFSPNSPLTISHSGSISGTIAMASQSIAPPSTPRFGKIYVKPYNFLTQTQALYFKDDNENEIKISQSINEEYLYVDDQGNTFGGYTPIFKPLQNDVIFNSAYGYKALYNLSTGSGNVSIAAAPNLATGNSNVFIGFDSVSGVTVANNNVIIGSKQFNFPAGGNNNIVVGYQNVNNLPTALNNAVLIGSGLNTNLADYTLNIGFGNDPVLTGSLGGGSRAVDVRNGSLGVWSELNDQHIKIDHSKRGSKYVSNITVKDTINTSMNSGLMSIQFADANNYTRTLMDFDFSASPMSRTANFSTPVSGVARPLVGVSGDVNLLGALRFSDGTYLESATILNGTLNFCNLPDALSISNDITTQNSYLALSVPSGVGCAAGRISLQSLSDFVGSGFAAVSNNCNFVWSNAESSIDKVKNSNSVFIGCNVATAATGWKHSVFIGTNAGAYAQTPNAGLATDTANIFIGYNAGYNNDNTANVISIGTNAGYAASGSQRSVYIGSNAGMDHNGNDCIGIGFHALRGDAFVQNGTKNIEIVAGLLDDQRLMYGSGNLSNRINIQNVIAGDTERRRISIGHATLSPDAVFSVRKNDVFGGHASTDYIQSWWCNNVRVAAIDCEGNFIAASGNDVATTIEGVMSQSVAAPISPANPTSGIINIKDSAWNNNGTAYIVNRDPTLTIPNCAYVIATKINGTYRPTWVSCSGVC